MPPGKGMAGAQVQARLRAELGRTALCNSHGPWAPEERARPCSVAPVTGQRRAVTVTVGQIIGRGGEPGEAGASVAGLLTHPEPCF